MNPTDRKAESVGLPDGFRPVALRPEDTDAPLRLCVAANLSASAQEHFIVLRDLADATVYLGCLTDREGKIKQWIEVWVQNLDHLEETFAGRLDTLNNAVCDRAWTAHAAALEAIDQEEIIRTGWEKEHPFPLFFNASTGLAVQPTDSATGRRWELARDEAALQKAELPSFGASLNRYLTTGEKFLPVTRSAPMPSRQVELFPAHLIAFNPGGLMLVRYFSPVGFGDFADLISGKSWSPSNGLRKLQPRFGKPYDVLEDPEAARQSGALLFLGKNGRAGRVAESFHLKLNLVLQAFRLVREGVSRLQLPFLDLNADSFRVSIDETGAGLPFLWTAKVALVRPPQALPLPLTTSEERYFLSPIVAGRSIYRPENLGAVIQGRGTVRIRKVLPPSADGIVFEGTLATDERVVTSASDLIQMTLPVRSGRVDLYAHLDPAQALAISETRFRTIPQKLSETVVTDIQVAAGAPFSGARFEILPLLTTPCDLYALAVVATRVLLVNDENTLPIAVDEVFSLARQLAEEHDPAIAFEDRLASLIGRDERWNQSLGPHRLVRDDGAREIAAKVLPPPLWWQTVGFITRLLPGFGPDSFARDFGDAPALALERVFDKPIAALELLQLRSRSLILLDWNANVEIREAIRSASK
ncbi:MAG TPA: hypothetical protein VIT21_04990 [Chthoniobacterales bacterium]